MPECCKQRLARDTRSEQANWTEVGSCFDVIDCKDVETRVDTGVPQCLEGKTVGDLSISLTKNVVTDTINGEVSITSQDWSFKGHYNHFNLHAEGQLIYKDQSSYLGSLIDFKKKGNGTYSLASGEQINGYWTNDYDVINATKKDKNGFIWKGAFKNLKPNGLIKVELPSSQSYDGIWSNGVMQRAVGAFGIKLRPFIVN